MTVQDYLRVLREQWLIIVSAVVVALVAACAVWLLRPPEYTARLTMYVSAQTADTAATAFEGAQLSQQRVSSYVELVSSTRVSREVIEELGSPAPRKRSPSRSPRRALWTPCSSMSPSPAALPSRSPRWPTPSGTCSPDSLTSWNGR